MTGTNKTTSTFLVEHGFDVVGSPHEHNGLHIVHARRGGDPWGHGHVGARRTHVQAHVTIMLLAGDDGGRGVSAGWQKIKTREEDEKD